MHKKNIQQKDYEALARLFSGEMSGDQERKARESMLADPEKKAMFEELSKYWEMMETPKRQKPVDTGKAWAKLNSRLQADGLLPEKSQDMPQPGRRYLFPAWMKYAASLLLLAVAGSLIYTSLRDRGDAEIFAENTSTDNQTLVQFLQDGSVVYLAENTHLSYPEKFDKKLRRVSLEGEAYFEVSGKQEQPFMVETQPATIQVIGTSFNVKSAGQDHFELYVLEGRVRVSPRRPGSRSIEVEPGEKIVYASGRFEKSLMPAAEASNWHLNRMHFKDETLENVLMVINRNLGANLTSAPEVSQRRMTVTFYQNTVPTITELISLSMNLEVEETEGSTLLFRPK
jgi:transmembrane sensor